MINIYDVIIVGGGASGIMCAIECAKFAKVALIETNNRVGKKILASGNGRCNLSNINISVQDYNTNKVFKILNKFNTQVIRDKWLEYGLLTKEEEDRIYPYSESANSVLNVLLNKLENRNIDLKLSTKVNKIIKEKDAYILSTTNGEFKGKYVVLACGSKATMGVESYNLAKSLNHRITKIVPSLAAIKSKSIFGANGVRCKVECYVEIDNANYPKEKGEFLFKDGAISGVLAFRMSSYIARATKVGYKTAKLHIDFAPEYSIEELKNIIIKTFYPKSMPLEGVFHKAIALNIIANTKMDKSLLISEPKALNIAKTAKDFIASVDGIMGLSNAQVVTGGVALEDIDMETLESKKNRNLFILGEMLDVDGECGGFNLHWAWASALACSNHIKEVF